jgi:hypothetical protein
MIFQNHRQVPVNVFRDNITPSEHLSLKRATGWIFRINFIEASKIFTIQDHNSKLFKNYENYHRTYRKHWFNFIVLKKILTS